MKTKPTEGEWQIANYPESKNILKIRDKQGILIASTSNLNGEANAKLIAAAPDMLEALKSAKILNLHLYEEGTIGNRVYKEIENAIKKATE